MLVPPGLWEVIQADAHGLGLALCLADEQGPHLLTAPELFRSVLIFDGLEFVDGVPKEGTLFLACNDHVI